MLNHKQSTRLADEAPRRGTCAHSPHAVPTCSTRGSVDVVMAPPTKKSVSLQPPLAA